MVAGRRRRPATSSTADTVMGSPPNRIADGARRSTSACAYARRRHVGDRVPRFGCACASRRLLGQVPDARPWRVSGLGRAGHSLSWWLSHKAGLSGGIKTMPGCRRTSWRVIASRSCCCRRACASGCLRAIWRGSCSTPSAAFDLGRVLCAYRRDGWGRAAHDPAMMVALLLYAYAIGERSSRRIERALRGRCRVPRDHRQPGARSRDDRALPGPPRAGARRSVRRGAAAVRRRRAGARGV